jgi:hypothetical protein
VILGIAGLIGAGKNTAAEILVMAGWHQVAFATQLKGLALDLNPNIHTPPLIMLETGLAEHYSTYLKYVPLRGIVQAIGMEEAKKFPEVRKFLQNLGVGVRDRVGKDSWVNALDHSLVPFGLHSHKVITDTRYPNEGEYIHSQGGFYLWIDNPRTDHLVDRNHSSESGVLRETANRIIVNDGTKDELWRKVLAAVTELSGGKINYKGMKL